MRPRWRSVCETASVTEAELLWRSQSPHTSMAGTLRSATNSSLRMLKPKEDYRELGADHFDRLDANRIGRGLVRWLERLATKSL